MNIKLLSRYVFRLAVCMAVLGPWPGTAQAKAKEYVDGPCSTAFGMKVCSFYQTRSGRLTEFGMSVPVAVIEKAPANTPMVWPPREDAHVSFAPVVTEQTGFTFANIYWEEHGHPPSIYMVPHFDFHFYFAPTQEVQAITCKDTQKPKILPAGYSLPDEDIPHVGKLVGICVPAMGMHAVPTADLQDAGAWTGSMLVGYYSQKPLFIEPMVPRTSLLRKKSFSLAIPSIEKTPHVRYPRRFRAEYVEKTQTYNFTFAY